MEPLATDMLASDQALREEYEEQVVADPMFAASPGARLNWLYQRSVYADQQLNCYPVGRLMKDIPLPTLR